MHFCFHTSTIHFNTFPPTNPLLLILFISLPFPSLCFILPHTDSDINTSPLTASLFLCMREDTSILLFTSCCWLSEHCRVGWSRDISHGEDRSVSLMNKCKCGNTSEPLRIDISRNASRQKMRLSCKFRRLTEAWLCVPLWSLFRSGRVN